MTGILTYTHTDRKTDKVTERWKGIWIETILLAPNDRHKQIHTDKRTQKNIYIERQAEKHTFCIPMYRQIYVNPSAQNGRRLPDRK